MAMDLNNEIKIRDTLLQSGSPILIEQLNLFINQPLLIDYTLNGGEEAMQVFLRIISLEPSIEDMQKYPGIKELDIISATISSNSDTTLFRIFNNFISMFFPDFVIEIVVVNKHAALKFTNKNNDKMPPLFINNLDFLLIKKYMEIIMNVSNEKNKEDYNPDSDKARAIKEKLEKGRTLRNKIKNKKHSVLFNLISSFAYEQKMSVRFVYENFTLYQFYGQYMRMNSKMTYDASLQALFAGAKDVKLPEWQGSI